MLRSHPLFALAALAAAFTPPLLIRDAGAPATPPGFHALASLPPAAGDRHDPADSLYQAGRQALAGGDFRGAARLFRQILAEHPDSIYAPDAPYWQAFALYRLGGIERMHEALDALDEQREQYPGAATRADGDALAVRIRGELARRGDAEAAERVTDLAGRTSDCPDEDDDNDVRIAALNALLQMDAERAMPILKQVLARRDDCSVGLRRKAVFLVAQQESPETEDLLLATARDDPDAEVRKQAVFWLSEVDTDKAVDALEEILETGSDPAIKEKALFALSEHEGERSRQILQRYAERSDVPVELREKAIFWIGESGDPASGDFLRRLFGQVAEPELKEQLLFAVSEMDDPGGVEWLLEVATRSNEDVEIRKKALFWAGESDMPIGELLGLYDRLDELELKEQLIFVYSQRDDDPAAVDRLIDIARTEPDPELRKKAIFWLGEMDDPRVVDFLSELINQ